MVSLESLLTCFLLPWPPCLPVFSVAACSPDPSPLGQQPDFIYPYWCPPILLPHPCDLGKDVRREGHLQVSNGILGQKGTVVVTAWSRQCHDMSCWCKSLPHPQSSYGQVLSWRLLPLKVKAIAHHRFERRPSGKGKCLASLSCPWLGHDILLSPKGRGPVTGRTRNPALVGSALSEWWGGALLKADTVPQGI